MLTSSVGLVAWRAVGDPALTHLDHPHLVTLQLPFELGDVLLEEFDRLQLMTSQEHVTAERELPATSGGLGVVGDQDCTTVIGVDRYGVVIGTTETRLDNGPAFVSAATSSSSTNRI